MEKHTAVSIIVPLYNRKETIARCLDSLVGQTLEDIEIVVVDDGSTDGGAEVVRKYQQADARIVLLVQENKGPGAARNAGIRASRGEYIGFVDCDDYVEKQMYERLFETAKKAKTKVAVCQEKNICFDKDGLAQVLSETKFPEKTAETYGRKQVLEWFLNFTYLSLNSVCLKLIQKEVFTEKQIWFPEDHRHVEDIVVSGGIFGVVSEVSFVPESLYCYIHETGTRSTSCSLKKAEDIYQDMLDILRYFKREGLREEVGNFVLGMKFSSMRQLCGSDRAERKKKGSRILKEKWMRAEKKVKPDLKGKRVPLLHKVKVMTAYWNLEAVMCAIFKVLGRIPFFRYMV